MDSLSQLVEEEQTAETKEERANKESKPSPSRSEFKALSDMFTAAELDTIRRTGGSLQSGLDYISDTTNNKAAGSSGRVLLEDGADNSDEERVEEQIMQETVPASVSSQGLNYKNGGGTPGNLPGVYKYVSSFEFFIRLPPTC